jgi:hypothetical protein
MGRGRSQSGTPCSFCLAVVRVPAYLDWRGARGILRGKTGTGLVSLFGWGPGSIFAVRRRSVDPGFGLLPSRKQEKNEKHRVSVRFGTLSVVLYPCLAGGEAWPGVWWLFRCPSSSRSRGRSPGRVCQAGGLSAGVGGVAVWHSNKDIGRRTSPGTRATKLVTVPDPNAGSRGGSGGCENQAARLAGLWA